MDYKCSYNNLNNCVFNSTNPERPGDLKESFDVECLDENLVSKYKIIIMLLQYFQTFMHLKGHVLIHVSIPQNLQVPLPYSDTKNFYF